MKKSMLSLVVKIYTIYKNQKEIVLYLLFGGVTFVVSIGSCAFFVSFLKINILCANVFSWILAVSVAFFTNKKWVFENKTELSLSKKTLVQEWILFLAGRIITLIIEELIIFLFVTLWNFDSMLIKVMAQIIVIIMNYFISKFMVFRNIAK